jgi:hypothetical protein
MAKGYKQASDGKSVPFEIVEAAPAGALSSTATDMAKFMLAHLNGGSYDGVRLLKPETERGMQTRNYTLAPGLNGFDLGFYEESRNGHHIIGHAGDTGVFHSDLHLITDSGTGIFMSFNSAGKEGAVGGLRTSLFRALLDRYFPFTPPDEPTVADPAKDAARVAGYYQGSRREETALKLLFQLGQIQVSALPDHEITLSAFKDESGTVKKWREVGPLDYREAGGAAHLKFVTDQAGQIDYLATDDFLPVELFQRVKGLEQLNLLAMLGGGTLVACILALAMWFIGWIVRFNFGRPLEMTPSQAWLRLASRLGALLFLAVAGGWVGIIMAIQLDEFILLNGGLNGWFTVLYVLGVLAVFGGLAMIANGISRIISGPGGWFARICELVLALVGAYGIWAIFDYGLANFYMNV